MVDDPSLEDVEPGCETYGHVSTICDRPGCGKNITDVLNPLGHVDANGDKICDRCGDAM